MMGPKEQTGAGFVRWIGPIGCAAFLLFGIVFTLSLFLTKGAAVQGYTPPADSRYYAQHPEELCRELEENLLPLLSAPTARLDCDGERVIITASATDLQTVRLAVIHYYSEKLFTFVEDSP